MLVLKKSKGNILIFDSNEKIENSYSQVSVPDRHINRLGISEVPFSVSQKSSLGEKLLDYIKAVNIYVSTKVPNARVTSDVNGTSKLNRHPEKGFIEITKRYIRKDGTCNLAVTSPNCCFISDRDRQEFFKDLDNYGEVLNSKSSSRKVIFSSSRVYQYWSKFMDDEYSRLSGIPICKKSETTQEYHGEEFSKWWGLVGRIGRKVFSKDELTAEFDYFFDVYSKNPGIHGLFTVLESKNPFGDPMIFDRDGRFIDYASWFCKKSLYEILRKLTITELEVLETVFI